MSAGGVVALLFVLGTVVALFGWIMYAYFNPQTPSGQFLIRVNCFTWQILKIGRILRYFLVYSSTDLPGGVGQTATETFVTLLRCICESYILPSAGLRGLINGVFCFSF